MLIANKSAWWMLTLTLVSIGLLLVVWPHYLLRDSEVLLNLRRGGASRFYFVATIFGYVGLVAVVGLPLVIPAVWDLAFQYFVVFGLLQITMSGIFAFGYFGAIARANRMILKLENRSSTRFEQIIFVTLCPFPIVLLPLLHTRLNRKYLEMRGAR
jgi:hypothetical protein